VNGARSIAPQVRAAIPKPNRAKQCFALHGGQQGAKPKAETMAEILTSIKERRT
jgi:hypothetical protein